MKAQYIAVLLIYLNIVPEPGNMKNISGSYDVEGQVRKYKNMNINKKIVHNESVTNN